MKKQTVSAKKLIPITLSLLLTVTAITSTGGSENPPLQEVWHRVYDSGCNDRAAALAVDSNNNIIVTGSSFIGGNTDYYTIKYDSDGATTWNVTFDGSWRDKPYGITVDSEDNIIVTGRSAIHGSDDFYTIKYDNKGNIIWSRTYDEWNDEAQDVTVDFHDNVIIAGYTNHGENDDCCIIKYSRNGTLLWNISYDGGGDDKLYAVATDTQNNIIAAGVSQTMLNGLAALIIKYTPDGEIVWENTTVADNNQVFDVTVDSQNNIIVVGSITIMGKKYLNIRKYDAEGNLLWEKVDEKPNTEANGVTVDREDNILVVGRYQKYGGPDYYYIKKYYPNGNPVWEHLYNTGHEDYPRDITVDNHGDIIVTGYSAIGDHDYVTIKYTELFGNKTPKARFTYTPSTPQVFDTVQFTDQSMDPDGNVTSWTWDFGDNNISTEQNPSHRYEKSGIYIVSLTVTDNKGKPDSTQRIVVVESGENTERPIANFDYHPVNPQPGDTVEFIDTSTDFDGVITQRLWVFHDNSTATAENVTFTYTQNGTYPVTLIVMDNDGVSDVKQKNIVVYVNDGNQPPQANFTYTPASPTTDDTVQFIDESMDEDGYITQWLWNFGDNTTSSASHPTHRYTVNGTYIVTLTVTDDGGKTDVMQQTIIVKSPVENQPPTADFTYSPKNPDTETTVHFKDLSTDTDGDIVAWLWDFGDGETSGEQNPVHRYTIAGTYTVTLNVTDNNGSSNLKVKQIQVEVYTPPTPPPPSPPPPSPPTPQQQAEENVLKTTLKITPQNVNGENGWYITKPMINLTASKPATIYYHWDEDDKQVYLHNITAPEGVHTIFYYSVDTSGTREEVQWKTLKVDTTKPYLESVYPGNNSFINNTKPVLKLNFSEEIQTIHSSLDNHEIEFNTNDNITFTVNTSLAEGKHRLRVEVKDEAGNQVSYVMEFTVDVTKPTAKVDLPSADDVVSEKNVYVTVNATDNYGVNQIEFKVIQGNTTFNSSTFSGEEKHVFVFNTSSYPDGSYTLVVRVSDYAGNSAIYSTTVTVSKEEVASPLLLLLLGIMVSTGFFIVYIVAVKRMKGKMVFQWIFHRILRNH